MERIARRHVGGQAQHQDVTQAHDISNEQQDIKIKLDFDAYGMTSELPDPVACAIRSMFEHMQAVDHKMDCMAQKLKELDDSFNNEALPTLKTEDFNGAVTDSN